MSQARFNTFVTWIFVGILSVLGLSYFSINISLLPGQSSVYAMNAQRVPLAIARDIISFNLAIEPDSLIPEGLRVSQDPFEEGRGVIGEDNRSLMTSEAFPWSTIGRVEGLRADGVYLSRCTGTLLATDVVLTNAHCVVDDTTHQVNQAMWFQPNLVNGELLNPADEAAVVEVLYGTDFRDISTANGNDWALLKLNQPLGETYGVLGWRSPSLLFFQEQSAALTMVGYSGDLPPDNPGGTASVHRGCSVLENVSDGFLHDCDSTGGASGAPIIAWIDELPYLVALHAGANLDGYTNAVTANYAVNLNQLKARLIAASSRGTP